MKMQPSVGREDFLGAGSWPILRGSAAPQVDSAHALNGRTKNLGPNWDRRVTALMKECEVDSSKKMAKLLTDVRR